MQDRLKARVFDKTENKMHYNDFVITATGYVAKLEPYYEVDHDDFGEPFSYPSKDKFIIDQTNLAFNENCVVMKSTGFRDEYQQLIFADDIVEVTIFDKEGNDFQFICKANVGDYGITFDEINKTENPQVFSVWSHNFTEDDLKIIGNVYENPELLKGGE